MDQAESTLEDIRSVEDPHLLRLTSVLHEMVRRGGLKGAARDLGIDHRTVGASLDEGRLTRRCREALERTLIERADVGCGRAWPGDSMPWRKRSALSRRRYGPGSTRSGRPASSGMPR